MSFKFDPSESGLKKILKGHEELALRYFWDGNEAPAGTKIVWDYVNSKLTERSAVSRATIINFLAKMKREGVLESRDATGKGGHRELYYANIDEAGFVQLVFRTLIDSCMRDFPQVTEEVLRSFYSE